MKTIFKFSLVVMSALAIAGCQQTATTNTNTNTNTNAVPKAAAPTADALLALDKPAWDAWKNKDTKFFEGFLADTFVGFGDDGKRATKAEVLKGISEHKCEVKSHSLSNPHLTPVSADVAVITYTATVDGTCEGQKIPSPVTVSSAFVRSGDTWKGVYHNEVAVIEPPKADATADNKAAATAPEKASETSAEKMDKAADTTAEKKEAPANTAANTSASTSSDALTEALMAMEKRGWDAWMKKDAAALQAVTTKDVSFIDVMGRATHGQENAVKVWTDPVCKATSVNVTEGKGTEIAPNVAILTFKGTAVGSCGDAKLEPLWGTTIAVKEGDTWKAAYIFETPMRKS